MSNEPASDPPVSAETTGSANLSALAADLERVLKDSAVQRDHPLGVLTTYRVGGSAALFVLVESTSDLEALVACTAGTNVELMVIGRGSNMLVADAGFPGLVIQLGEAFTHLVVEGDILGCGAGWSLPVLARKAVGAALTGFEWAVGVPGSLGGAVRMNAGGHGSDMAASLVQVQMADLIRGEMDMVAASDLNLAYRSSNVASHQVVVGVTLQLAPGDPVKGQEELSEIVRWRREHQPGGQNAGSVFTNPNEDSAGRLIDVSGLKGYRLGTAQVSPKHANFIQADPQGRSNDILALMQHVQARVLSETGVSLHPETRLVGFGPYKSFGPYKRGEAL